MIKKIFFFAFVVIFAFSCTDDENDKKIDVDFKKQADNNNGTFDETPLNQIIESFSSSIEMAAVIENLGVPFSEEYIVPSTLAKNFDSNFKKAIGLGMYSADLGYLNVNNETNRIIEYLKQIKRLSGDLDIDQFFDFKALKELATNREDLKKLMMQSVESYNNMSAYLRASKRTDLSALMVSGVWVEGLFLACKVNNFKASKKLKDRVGSQKEILAKLYYVLKYFKDKPYFADLISDLGELKEAYTPVRIIIEKGEGKEIINDDGTTTFVPDETTTIIITDEQLKEISNIIIKIRNKLIS